VVYTGAVTVSVSVAVECIVTVELDVDGSVATGLTKIEVVPVVKDSPPLGETPLNQLVVPKAIE